jgi:hypothetical protein
VCWFVTQQLDSDPSSRMVNIVLFGLPDISSEPISVVDMTSGNFLRQKQSALHQSNDGRDGGSSEKRPSCSVPGPETRDVEVLRLHHNEVTAKLERQYYHSVTRSVVNGQLVVSPRKVLDFSQLKSPPRVGESSKRRIRFAESRCEFYGNSGENGDVSSSVGTRYSSLVALTGAVDADHVLYSNEIENIWWSPRDFKEFRLSCNRIAFAMKKSDHSIALESTYENLSGQIEKRTFWNMDTLKAAASLCGVKAISRRGLEFKFMPRLAEDRKKLIRAVLVIQSRQKEAGSPVDNRESEFDGNVGGMDISITDKSCLDTELVDSNFLSHAVNDGQDPQTKLWKKPQEERTAVLAAASRSLSCRSRTMAQFYGHGDALAASIIHFENTVVCRIGKRQ